MTECMGDQVRIDTLHITSEFLRLIAALDEFKGAWEVTGRIAPERLLALRRVATIESVGSATRIEGARLTDVEVERLLSRLDITTLASRDEQEVAGYADAMDLVFDSRADIDLTENHIRQLHQVLLQHSSKDLRHRGDYNTRRTTITRKPSPRTERVSAWCSGQRLRSIRLD